MSQATLGAPLPPDPDRRFYKCIHPKMEQVLKVTLLADTFRGEWTHWRGRPFLCYRCKDCWGCQQRMPNRWNGYIACWDHGEHRRRVLQLSEGAARQLLPLKVEYGGLRGCCVELRRADPRKENSPVIVKLLHRQEPGELMKEHPIDDSLNHIWGINEDWGRKAPLEAPGEEDDEGTIGAPMPPPRRQPDETPATPDQWRRMRQVMGGMFGMPGEGN